MPAFDAFSARDAGTGDIDVEFTVEFTVSSTGPELATMIFELTDLTDGVVETNSSVAVTGSQDSGAITMRAPGDRGQNHSYEVWAEVADVDGNTQTATLTLSEGGSTGDGGGNGGNGGGIGIDATTIALGVGAWWLWRRMR